MWSDNYQQYTDEQLVQIITSSGNTSLFGLLYDRYAQKIYGKCLDMVKHTDDAQDLVHEILAKKVFLKLNTFEGNSSFRTWVYRIAHNHCIDYLRDRRKIVSNPYEDTRRVSTVDDYQSNEVMEVEAEDEIARKELFEIRVERLQVLMDMLDAEDRSLLLMKYRDDMSIDDLREILQLSGISATKMRLKRARDRLRKLYQTHFTDDEDEPQ